MSTPGADVKRHHHVYVMVNLNVDAPLYSTSNRIINRKALFVVPEPFAL